MGAWRSRFLAPSTVSVSQAAVQAFLAECEERLHRGLRTEWDVALFGARCDLGL